MDDVLGEQAERRKQTGIEQRRATIRSKTTTPTLRSVLKRLY